MSVSGEAEFNLMGARPIFGQGSWARSSTAGNFRRSPITTAVPDQRIELQRILDRLRRDEFSARCLDQILLAIRDRKESVTVDVPDVAVS